MGFFPSPSDYPTRTSAKEGILIFLYCQGKGSRKKNESPKSDRKNLPAREGRASIQSEGDWPRGASPKIQTSLQIKPKNFLWLGLGWRRPASQYFSVLRAKNKKNRQRNPQHVLPPKRRLSKRPAKNNTSPCNAMAHGFGAQRLV